MSKHTKSITEALAYLEENLTETELRQLAGILMGRVGGSAGGKARKKSLTPERRREIAQKAAEARWKKGEEHDR